MKIYSGNLSETSVEWQAEIAHHFEEWIKIPRLVQLAFYFFVLLTLCY